MIGVVIFSRLNSSRLPGKALLDMDGRPLLGYLIDRLRYIKNADRVIVATSDETSDDTLAAFVEQQDGISLYRGCLDDVSGRALGCMRAFDLDVMVRICGDSPFEIPAMIDHMIELREDNDAELLTNVQDRTYPSGLSVEVVSRDAYERAYSQMSEAVDFEHVTHYFYQHPKQFKIVNVVREDGGDLTHLNLCVDTAQDLKRASWIAQHLGDNLEHAGLEELIAATEAWYTEHPEDRGKAT
ncbi:MAG: NTP transferase domain-containing protein [Magnetovibrio sp.]|nr:NTP transferase domain-containing protein [Magnetovibrio sp.]